VIGGGIAGAAVASALHHNGLDVTVFEKTGIASGGSGNIRGLINPKFTAQRGVEADFYAPAFALANRVFKEISVECDIGYYPCGSLHLLTDDSKEKRFHGFIRSWEWHDNHARLLSADDASLVAGVGLSHAALFLPDAAMVSPKILTEFLLKPVKMVRKEIDAIIQDESAWVVAGEEFDAVILAGGFDVKRFPQLAHMPFQKVRGQVTRVKMTTAYAQLKTNLCYGGYASSGFDGEAVIGSTFQHWIDDDSLRPEDDADNIKKLATVVPCLAEGLEIIGARAAFRCAAKDRVPIIGAVGGHEGLFITAAHGSHGILSGLMGAEFIAAKICGEGQILPQSVERFLSPSRFRVG
jgi:tRNA 5-methylaminomethyl-2-thiouridine biosynthesis bifunctional protein